MEIEAKQYNNNLFVTLTYDNNNLPNQFSRLRDRLVLGNLCPDDLTLFIKRLRKALEPARIRYYACGEYGSKTYRPHYHIVIFNYPDYHELKKLDPTKLIHRCWGKGHIMVSPVNSNRLLYVAKYCIKSHDYIKGTIKPFSRMSRRPAIGSNYITPNTIQWHRRDLSRRYLSISGRKFPLPSTFKAKLYPSKLMNDHYVNSKLIPQIDKQEADKHLAYIVSNPNGNYFKDVAESIIASSNLVFKNSKSKDKL